MSILETPAIAADRASAPVVVTLNSREVSA
jgi:hypothetical protein